MIVAMVQMVSYQSKEDSTGPFGRGMRGRMGIRERSCG